MSKTERKSGKSKMCIIYELIFLELLDTAQKSKLSRLIRILTAILISMTYIITIISLGIYVVIAVDQGIFKKSICAFCY